MKVHLFGATSSPSCAAFSLRQTALDFGHGYEPLVASTVEGAAYVDDVLTSVSDVETGIKLVDGLRSMLAKAGFRLTKGCPMMSVYSLLCRRKSWLSQCKRTRSIQACKNECLVLSGIFSQMNFVSLFLSL